MSKTWIWLWMLGNQGNYLNGRLPATITSPKQLVKPKAKPGQATALPSQVETSLAQQITKAAETGFGINRMQLAAKAAQVARRLQLQNTMERLPQVI